MSESSGFFVSAGGDRKYKPDWLAKYIEALVTTGVYEAELGITANGDMTVTAPYGRAWIRGYMYLNDAPLALQIDTADGSLSRKDAIFLRLNLTARTIGLLVQRGEYATTPVAPTPTRTDDVYDLKLAEISVPAGTTKITQELVKDCRTDETVCGITVSAVQYIPTAEYMKTFEAEFLAWFETIKGILGEDEAGKLLQMIQALQEQMDVDLAALEKKINEDFAISEKTLEALGLSSDAKLDDALYAAGKHIVLDVTFLSAFVGKTYTITGAGLTTTVTGTVPSGRNIQVPVLQTNCDYTMTCNGTTAILTTDEYFGIYKFMIAPALASCTPAQIAEVAASGLASKVWEIGDEINITLTTNEVVTMQIYDFDHDTLATGGLAPITFGMKNLMATTRQMNTSNTNSGGWPGSAMYSALNTTIYNTLPSAWRSVIKKARKLTSAGNQSTTINSSDDYLFLFCEEEIFGGKTYAVAGEGKQYPIFTDATSRIKRLSNGGGSANYWWERSPYASNSTNFCVVSSDGAAYYSYASYSIGVCFGFVV